MLQEWKTRPLEEVYPFIFLDAIHYKVKEDGRYISKAFYTVLGVGIDGKKEILGLYLGESEGAKNTTGFSGLTIYISDFTLS